jgi:hypothetical protein
MGSNGEGWGRWAKQEGQGGEQRTKSKGRKCSQWDRNHGIVAMGSSMESRGTYNWHCEIGFFCFSLRKVG